MTDFTPNTAQVRDAYVRAMRNAFIASAGEHAEEFDRWLKVELHVARQDGYALRIEDERNGIDADRDEWLDGVKADAWDRGYTAGASDDFTNQPHRAPNPYRSNDG